MARNHLTDDQLWMLVCDTGHTPVATWAVRFGVSESAICHRRRTTVRHGWSCPLHWTTCPVCGQSSASQGRPTGPHPHPWCRPERDRRQSARHRQRDRARGITSTPYVRQWRADPANRAKHNQESRERSWLRMEHDPAYRAAMLDQVHAYDDDAYEQTKQTANNTRTRWTADEDARIIAELDRPAADLAQELGRTLWSVRGRRVILRERGLIDRDSRAGCRPSRSTRAQGHTLDAGSQRRCLGRPLAGRQSRAVHRERTGMINHARLAVAIRDARLRAGLTQVALADRLGMRTKRLDNIEGGYARLATTEIPAVAAALGIDPDELYAVAGVVPHDIANRLAGDLAAIRTVRDALGLPAAND